MKALRPHLNMFCLLAGLLTLARLYRAGELSFVHVPDEADEATAQLRSRQDEPRLLFTPRFPTGRRVTNPTLRQRTSFDPTPFTPRKTALPARR